MCLAASLHAGLPASDAAPPFCRSQQGKTEFVQRSAGGNGLATGALARPVAPLVNWAADNKPVRAVMEKVAGIDAKATLPKIPRPHFLSVRPSIEPGTVNQAAPAFGKRKAALYATCFVNYNKPETGMDARAVLISTSAWKPKSLIPAAAACPSWNRPSWNAWRRMPPKYPRNSASCNR